MRNRISPQFFFLSLGYFVLGAILLIIICKGNVVIFLNKLHTPFLDLFFKYWTHLGDGLTIVLMFILLLFFTSYYKVLVSGIAFSLMGICIRVLKRGVFPEAGRPKDMFWTDMDQMNLVEGVRVNTDFSFPSGHTASAFIMVLVLVWVFNKKNILLQYILFLVSFLVGISRIYLFQHFFIDTYFGTLLSFFLGYLIIWFFEEKTTLKSKKGWDKNLTSIFNK